ncbi:hypothetical protein OAU99_01925 [Candidatus Poseidoniaceae archaeon]|mgnify:CR=1 FL=1|jgi:uncharacterized membrane protein|nr:hypothetical protein [bacterium]MDC3290151.1 hypothetical protein [bacterium]MDC3298114.1 hypothetical protein [Candidatus Poseidoniaceae archaeon]
MSDKNLTPYFLAIGPLLLIGAYSQWPAADAIGIRGTQSLIDEADSLMPLLIAATLGTLMVLGGLYLLISDMMSSATGMNKQLLSLASVLVVLTMAFFVTGMGSNVTVINAEDAEVDSDDEPYAFFSESDKLNSQSSAFETGNTIWQMSPVTWGLSLVIIGLVSFMTKRPESAMDYVMPALMPVGTLFLSLPILNNPGMFAMVFPAVLLVHVIIGGLMLSGKLSMPDAVEGGA